MNQPDLVSKLREPIGCLIAYHEKEAKGHVSSQWIYSNHMFAVNAYKKVLTMLDGLEHESLLGREGQAANKCQYCNRGIERKLVGVHWVHQIGQEQFECCYLTLDVPPSTPIVPGTAGLSAENIKLKIGSRFYDREPYSGAWDEPFNVACEVLNAALAERPAPAGEVTGANE